MLTKYFKFFELVSLFGLSLCVFSWGLQTQEIIGFESRFYLFALEMKRHGLSWFPTTYGQLYPDYPVTATFLIYCLASVYGSLNKLIAVLPSACAAAITLVMTYLIGKLHSKRFGWYAVFFLLLTMTFLKNARSVALDMYPTMITTCCFFLVSSERIPHKFEAMRYGFLSLLLLAGFAFRGPIGIVLPTGVVCSYYLVKQHYKKLFSFGFLALLLLVISTTVLLGLAYLVGGKSFMQQVLGMQMLSRIENNVLPFHYYFTSSLETYALSFPFTGLVLLGLVSSAKTNSRADIKTDIKFLLPLFAWVGIILIGMSIAGDKKIRYILPMVPACALISAYIFTNTSSSQYFYYLRKSATAFFCCSPIIFLIGLATVYLYIKNNELFLTIHYFPVAMSFVILQVIFFWIMIATTKDSYQVDEGYQFYSDKRYGYVLLCVTVGFVINYIFVIEPVEIYFDRSRELVNTLEKERLQEDARLIFYRVRPDGLPIKYLINMSHEEHPGFIYDENILNSVSGPALFITRESTFNKLSYNMKSNIDVVAQESLGHVPIIAFKRTKI